jgi:hypothetical protein
MLQNITPSLSGGDRDHQTPFHGRSTCRARLFVSIFALLSLLPVIAFGYSPYQFTTGQKIRVISSVGVRDAAAGNVLYGTQPSGATGVVVSGPVRAQLPSDGRTYDWYQIDYDNSSLDGWSAALEIPFDDSGNRLRFLGLHRGEVASLAHQAQFHGFGLVVAVAIAEAESIGMNPSAVGDFNICGLTGPASFGLWQINTSSCAHGDYAPFRQKLLSSPLYCAQDAWIVSGSQTSFHPWSTWFQISGMSVGDGNGVYKSYVSAARDAIAAFSVDPTVITSVGNSNIRASSSTYVRQTPGGSLVASGPNPRSSGDVGTIIDGSTDTTYLVQVAGTGRYYFWWKVQWSDGQVGWSVEDALDHIPTGTPAITSATPTAVTVNQGQKFTLAYTVQAPSPRMVILGASLFPSGQTSGRVDDPSNDVKVGLSTGSNMIQRQFVVPLSTATGSYDVVLALWDDLNNNGQIDSWDQEITTLNIPGAVTVTPSGSVCSYSLDPAQLDLTTPGAASAGFNVFAGSACSWNAISNQNWITITDNASGTGFGQPTFSVAANTSSSSRTGTISVQGQTFTITQPGATSPSGGYQNVTVSDVLVAPPSSRPGLTPTFYADVSSPISQNVLLGATIVFSGSNTAYYDSAHDTAATLIAGQTQYHRSFTIPTNVPVGTYDVIFGVWADTNGNGIIDNTSDVYLGSFTGYGALTVQPALGGIYTTLGPQGAIDAGGQWRCDGGNWIGSGAQQFQTSVGYHTISFEPVPGWITPPDQVVNVQTAQTTQVIGTYINASGTTVPVTVQSDPPGASFTVDSVTFTNGAATFNWIPGSTHTISTNSSQSQSSLKARGGSPSLLTDAGGADTQYQWTGWSDYFPIIHNVAPSTATTLTAYFSAQYYLTVQAGAGGSVSSSSGWYSNGETVNISATPAMGYVFAGWNGIGSGSYSGPNASASVTMIGPIGETATFVSASSPTPTPAPSPALPVQLGNISTRLRVGTGDNALIGGFIVTGTQQKKVIVRGLGPSLKAFGVSGVLADPVIEVHDSSGNLIPGATNDNWNDAGTRQEIIDSGLAPTNDLESALWGKLNPGAYTVVVRGNGDSTGVGVFEVYDLDQTVDSKLANISTRGFVDTGDNVMIGGTIITGSTSARVLFRAIGPSLISVPNALQDPTLELHDSQGSLITSNDNWRDTQEAEIIATTIPPADDRESAILADLQPGQYTAIVRGSGDSTGVAVVEAYQLQ